MVLVFLGCFASAGRTEVTPEDVARWHKAAEQGDAKAQYNLGIFYSTGDGVKQDSAKAVHWYRKAVKQGFAEVQDTLRSLTW